MKPQETWNAAEPPVGEGTMGGQVPGLRFQPAGASRTLLPSKICSYGRVEGVPPFPRTPNPDHKGTNTIGREVREEIGWW